MGSIKASLLDLQHKLRPARNFLISGFAFGVGAASFFLLSLMILIANWESTSSSLFFRPVILGISAFPPNSSLVSCSSCCDTNGTLLGNFTHTIEKRMTGNKTHVGNEVENKTHFGNLELKANNESFHRADARVVVRDDINLPRNSGPFDISLAQGKRSYDDNIGVSFMERECDIFDGRWVRDERLPYYPPGSCPQIDRDFNCHLNGRPDTGFYSWRWQPNGCSIPRLNASVFLERFRGKKLVFVGDSLNRNMWESLVCILRHNIENKTRVYEISGKREFKKEGFYAFRFEDYNCSIDYVRAPFLVRESMFPGKNGPFSTLRLDLMDETTKMYRDAHVLVFNTGHWWTHEKTSRGEDYYQEGNHVYHRLKVLEAYRRALTTWGKWVDRNIDGNRTRVFFGGYSITHFRGGQWNSGGQCHKETEPILNETYLGNYPSKMIALEQVLNQMKTPVIYLNISRLTDYRKDAHPSIYRKSYNTTKELIEAEKSQDCSHWCLPGVPDIWNELFYASLLKAGWGSPFLPKRASEV